MSPRLKNVLKNTALVLATFVFCFVALELVLRVAGYGKVEIYQPHPLLYWRNKPNQDSFTTVERKRFTTNSKGTRGPEFSETKPPGTIRILCLGDSRTFGWGLADNETYSALLQKYLQERVGNRHKIEVINAGVNSWSFAQMNVYFREFALKYQPDFVLLGDANLWTQFSENNSPEFVRAFMNRIRLKNLLRRSAIYHYILEVKLRDAYDRYRARFIPVDPRQDTLFKEQQQKDPAGFFKQSVESLCRTARSNNVTPVILFFPIIEDLTDTNKSLALQAKQAVSQELDVPLINFRSEILANGGEKLYLNDPVHFTVEGNIVIAKKLTEVIAEMLK